MFSNTSYALIGDDRLGITAGTGTYVPEPNVFALCAIAAGGLVVSRRKRRRA